MEQRSNDAAVKDARNMLSKEECAEGMEQGQTMQCWRIYEPNQSQKGVLCAEGMERRSDYKAVKDAYKNKHGKEYAYAA